MSFRLKFNLVLCLAFLLALVSSALYYKNRLEIDTLNEVKHEANLSLNAALAIRSYSSRHIKPFFDDISATDFKVEGIPAFAALETMRILFEKYPDYQYRETVLNPLNLDNLPKQKWESDLISRFRSGEVPYTKDSVSDFVSENSLFLIRPIKIHESSCLACHGRVEDAPLAMVARYGKEHGYDWKINEIVGIQTVEVPLTRAKERSAQAFQHFLWPFIAVFLLLFATLNIVLNRWVVQPMTERNKRLRHMASTDSLTGLRNRRAFLERLELEFQAARFHHSALSLVVFDLDHFKAINDTFGHEKGDQVLIHTATILKNAIRASDDLARIGGEEFALLLPSANTMAAVRVAEQMRHALEHRPLLSIPPLPPVTGSFGVATWNGTESAEELIKRADDAAYIAKNAGRNRVIVSDKDKLTD